MRTAVVAALLFGGTLLLFSRLPECDFTNYDDPRYVTANRYVQSGFTWDSIRWAFLGRSDYWHPLTWLSHMLDWSLFGDNAAGHHLTSVLWHAANAVLAFLVLKRLTARFWPSAFAAALFAWHPLRVESVAWVAERKDVMSGAFFFLTIWVYAEYARRRQERRPALLPYLGSLALFTLGLMCKPTLVALPVLLLVLDYWPLTRFARVHRRGSTDIRRLDGIGLVIVEKVPFFLLSGLTAIATARMQRDVGAFILDLPLSARLANAPVAIVRYLGKFFWPESLTVCYPHPGWWPVWAIVVSTTIVVAITALAWHGRYRRPWALVGWLWFLVMLLPVIGIVQVGFQAMAERYTYLPMLGWGLLVTWAAGDLVATRFRTVGAIAAGAMLAAIAVRTWLQEPVWRNSETLFRHAVAVTRGNDVAEGFLGYTLANRGQFDEATRHCTNALALNPQNEMAVYTLASIHAQQGRIDEAIVEYRHALDLRSTDAMAQYNLGTLLVQTGRPSEAAGHLDGSRKRQPSIVDANRQLAEENERLGHFGPAATCYVVATLFDPTDASAFLAAGRALRRIGRAQEALPMLEKAVQLKPGSAGARVELGLVLLQQRNARSAVEQFHAALAAEPSLATASAGLGRAEELLGHVADADACFRRALAAAPLDPAIQRAWAEILARRGRFADAVPFYRQAVQLRPGDAENHVGLGYALFLSDHREEAVLEWKEALRLDPHFPGLRERLARLGGGR